MRESIQESRNFIVQIQLSLGLSRGRQGGAAQLEIHVHTGVQVTAAPNCNTPKRQIDALTPASAAGTLGYNSSQVGLVSPPGIRLGIAYFSSIR